MSARSDIAAGILLADEPWPDRATVIAQAADELRRALSPTTVWQSAYLPPELRSGAAYGEEIPRWRARDDVTPDEEQALEAAWSAALPPLGRGMHDYLRVRVDSPDDVRRLRAISDVDGLTIVPSLDSRGGTRPLWWRWPFRVGVAPGPLADDWLATVQNSSHHETVFDAELFDATNTYDIALVSATELPNLSVDWVAILGEVASCVIVAGDAPAEAQLMELEGRIEPMIAVAVAAPPADWWGPLFHEMSHDAPIDVAVESVVRSVGVDALISGPRWGMDITASAHWFAAVAPDFPQLAPLLEQFGDWNWREERGGTTTESRAVRAVRAEGMDPTAFVPPPARAGPPRSMDPGMGPGLGAGPPEGEEEEEFEEAAPPAEEAKPSKPRRLVARVLDGESVVESILPPKRDLTFAVRIAIPEKGDVAADKAAPALPEAPGPTVELEVVVRGDVWPQPPASQAIAISRDKLSQPSTWAAFPFTTPDSGGVVSIEILVLYQGKPLQAAAFVSPVRAAALPAERPTLTTFALSGPDLPTDELRPVDVTLDGRGAELVRVHGGEAKVLITGVQAMLDKIEDRLSRVLGVPGAPDSFDDKRAVDLLITLARLGVELDTFLAPLDLGGADSINVIINPDTRVLPLELAYAGPPPDKDDADLCEHVAQPPPPGEACDRVSTKIVCPYAFWGLHRSIARTVAWEQRRQQASATRPVSAFSMLYAATVIADDGASDPLPTASVFDAAETVFPPVTRVTSWTAWRKAVKKSKPNLLVLLGHTMVEGGETNLYIGKNSALARVEISAAELRATDSPPPLVLLIACATAALGDPFGTLPGALTAKGAGAVVGTLSKIIGPHGAAATTHLLHSFHDLAGTGASVGDAVAGARRSLVAEKRPIGLILVSHGEVDTKVVA